MSAVGQLLSVVERGGGPAAELSNTVHPDSGSGYMIGITGAPGVGKSAITSCLISMCRRQGDRVGVLAVDPSSPFSGGAILGDRVRMAGHSDDDGVLIRSLASRGHLGGLSVASREAARLLEAVGYDWVLLETVGVGQNELEISGAADTTLVVVHPAWGDEVQAAKAGHLEIADVFVINKADHAGADDAYREFVHLVETRAMLGEMWHPPVIKTVATSSEGIDDLWTVISEHRRWLEESGELAARRLARAADEVESAVLARLRARVAEILHDPEGQAVIRKLRDGSIDPASACELILAELDARR